MPYLLEVRPYGIIEEFDEEPTFDECEDAFNEFIANEMGWELIYHEDNND